MNDNKRKLYDALSNDYDMGTYEQFRKDLEDKDKRRKLYDATSDAYDFGDYDQFEAQLGYGQSPSAPGAEEINSGSAGPVMPKPAMENRNWEVQMGNGHSRATVEKPEPVDVPIPQRPEDQEPSGDVRSYLENANRQQVANLSRDINSRLDEAQTKSRDIYMKEQEDARKGGFLSTLAHAIAASGHNPEGGSGGMSDAQQRTLQGANSELQSEISKLEAAKKAMSNAEEIIAEADKSVQEGKFPRFVKGVARGFGDKLFDVNTWDMGVSDTKNSIELLKALRKHDEGEPLSESEQMLLDAKSVELATNAYFGSYIGRGYKAGAVTAQSLPFMLEMAVNPASTLGESTQSMLARYALSRFAKEGATRAAQKFATKAAGAAGRALGDIAGSAVMAGTSGAVRVAGDAIDRYAGDIETDMGGQGQTVFAGHDPESLGKSIAKAFTSTAIENHSEMLGEYFAPALGIVSKLGRKGMEKFGLKKVVDFVDDVSATDAAKLIADFQKRTKWNGTIGEYAEEVAGNIENAILVGDNTLDASDDTGVFNLDQNIDTFLGVALMGGVFSAVRTAMWRTPKYRARMEMEKARDEARTKYGSEAWQEIEDRMAEAGDSGMSAVLSTVIAGENSPEKAKALLDYAKSIKKYEGMLAGDEKRREIASPEATDLETSYENGYTLSTPQEVHDAKLMFEYQEAMLQKALGTSDIDIDTIMLGNEMGTLTDEQKSVAMDYLNAKATFDGVIDRVRDDIDSRISSVENAIDASTNRDTGMLQPASLVDDRPVHIISGIVRLTPDGTMVDTRNSENFIIVRDDRTGRMETISPSDINRLENEIDPAMEKQAARQQIQDVYGSREADSIDGVLAFNPGDTYTLTNGQGQSFPVQIVENEQGSTDNGDGTVNVILNNDIDTQTGQPRITQMPKEQIQEMAEATNLSRLQQYEQQKLARAAEQAETDAAGRTPENPFRINDKITLSDAETGNMENGVVGSELTDNGKYEVVVEKQDGSQSILYLSPSELEQLGARLEQPEGVEERNAPVLGQNQPVLEQNQPVLEQNQPVLEQKTEKAEQESAMSRIPSDRDGEPQFEQAQPSDTWEALLELNSGNAVEAEDTARQMYENASKNLDKAQKTKPKSGTSVMEIQRNKAERNGQIDELRKSVDFWGKVLSFPEAVRKSASAAAEAEVRQKEDAKREAVRQAKENLAKGRKLMQQKGTYYKDDAKLGDYLDFHDYALRMIANGRVKFVWKNDADNNSIKGLGGHLGLEDSESERKALFSLLANQDKGGLRPDDAAEQLSEEYNSSLGAEVISSSEALDVILDIIRTYGGKTRDMMNAAIDAHAMAGMDERGHDEDNKSSEDKDNSKIAEGQESLPADAPLSNEMNEFGVPFIESSDGTTVFGVLTDDSGLSPAPIKLSLGENATDKNGTNHGYGLLHIEAGHGDQIRAAGYSSIKDFVEDVARNYDTIREGGIVANNQTYLLELSDEHNNTLFIQLSRDGSYWNINSAGIFKKKYSRRKPEVFTRPALKTETDTDSGRVDSSRFNGATAPAGNSHQTSEGKDTNISEESNTGSEKSVAEQITEQREVVNTEPTEAQKEAGNYRMGHVKIDGMDVTIENPKGSIRRGTDADGKKWESEMHYDYGYIRGTKAVDNDHIDIFLSDNPETGNVFVVDQVNPKTGEFDESKVMYGFASEQEARDAYLSNYEKGWKGLGKITEVTREEFKKWIESSTRKTKPFSEYASVKTAEAQKEKGTSTEVSDSSKNNTSDKASERGFILMDDFIESALQEAYENRTDKSLSRDDWNEEDEAIDAENKANDDYYQYIESLSNSGELQKMYDASSIGEQIKMRKSIGEAGHEFKDLIDTTKAADARKEAREKKKKEEYRLKMKTLGIDIEDDDVQPSTKKPEAQKEMPVQGLEGYSRDEIKGIVTDHINDVMRDYDIDAEIIGMDIHGSRNRHDARPDSDLDVVVEYSGDIREDDMFNALNGEEDALSIEGIKVDINPIRKEETGDLQDYMKQSEEYDKEKSEHAIVKPLDGNAQKNIIVDAFREWNGKLRKKYRSSPQFSELDNAISIAKYQADEGNVKPDAQKNFEKAVRLIPELYFGSGDIQFSIGKKNYETTSSGIKDFAEKYGVSQVAVEDYANGMRLGTGAGCGLALQNIRHDFRLANSTLKFAEFAHEYAKLKRELFDKFGDYDKLKAQQIAEAEARRDAMEAARKRIEEEQQRKKAEYEARIARYKGMSLDELDSEYFKALENKDEVSARDIVDEVARRNGYVDVSSDYQGVGAWAAPSRPGGYTDEERRASLETDSPDLSLEDISMGYTLQPDDIFDHPERYVQGDSTSKEAARAIKATLNALKKGNKDAKIKVFRAVPLSVKEGRLRNGDWVTPSRAYADMHGNHRLEGEYRVIEEEVPAKDLWWDGNDVREWGYDDGTARRYANVENNTKLNDVITRDDAGNIIPPSRRFDLGNADERYQISGRKAIDEGSEESRIAYEAVKEQFDRIGIPVELLSDQAMREMAINATMLDTALPEDESSFKGTVISSIDGAKVLRNLDNAIDDYQNVGDKGTKTFLGDLASALGSSDKDKSSQYATFETKNGQVVTIRVSNHNATVSNFDNAGESNGISIVISRKPNEGMTNDGNAHIVEFFYPDKALNKAEGKPLVEILKSIKQSLYSGEYKDTTGLAQREEVNAKESVEFLREPDGTVYGATVGGKIYLNRERLNPNTPIHEYTHLWFSALEKANPELYKRGMELMKQLPIWEEVKTDPNYANLSGDDAIASECLSRLVGDKGAEKLTELAKKAMVRGDIIGTANRISLIEEFKDWLKKFWTWVRDSFAPWTKEEASRVSVDDIQNMVLSDLVKGVNPLARQAESDPYIRFSIVKDPKLIEELDKGPKVRVYRAMQLIDGKLYPPMASKINGEFVRPIELGKWEQADEHPELIDKNGRFNLNKGNGKGLKAAYNPYIHTSRTPLNDQFSEAQSRPNIVTVEVEIPKSELSSGYKADKAKDPVGEMEWKAGIVQGQLTGKRKVILSRWDKPIRIVPDSEVANVIVNDMFKGRTITMPSNVVTPSLRAELEKLGVPFVQTDNTGHIVGGQYDGKHYSKVYGNGVLAGNSKSNRMESEIDRIVREAKENGTYMKAPDGNPNIRYKQDGAVNDSRTSQDVEAAATKLAESLGEKVRIVRDVNEIENRNEKVQENQRRSKGWFNTGTGEIVVVLPNATGIEDVQATILHEAVGHKGLRELVGDDRFDDFLDKVYAAATKATRLEIVGLARRNHWDFRLATEEYIAGLAEKGFSGRENRTLFGKIKDFFLDMLSRAKIALGFNIGDNELRYMLWRTYQMRTSRGILAKANDMAVQQELKVGNFREDNSSPVSFLKQMQDNAETLVPRQLTKEIWDNEIKGKVFSTPIGVVKLGENQYEKNIKKGRELEFGMLIPTIERPDAIFEEDAPEAGAERQTKYVFVKSFVENGVKKINYASVSVRKDGMEVVASSHYLRDKQMLNKIEKERMLWNRFASGSELSAQGGSTAQSNALSLDANLLKGVKKTNSDEEILSGDDSRLRFRTSGNGGSSNTARDIYEEKTRVIDRNGRKSDTANLMRRLKEAYVDSMQSLKYLQDAISEETGKPVEDFENAYLAENSMSSKNKAQTDIYLNRFFNPIKDAIRDLQKEGAEYGDIVRYLMAKHGLERNEVFSKRDAEKDGGVWDGSVRRDYSGLTELTRRETDTVAPRIDEITSRAEDIVRKFEMDHDTDVLWEKINDATKDTLRTSYITGMLTKDNYEMVRSMFRYYIPLRGWSENTASAVYDYLSDARPKTSSIVKAATGRTTISDDPIATIAYMGQSAIIQGNRNLMKQKLLNLALNHKTGLLTVSRQWEVLDPVTGMWTPRDPDIPADAAPEQVADIVADFEKDMKEAEKKGVARLSMGKLDTGKHLTAYEGQEHIIKVKRGGIDYSIYLNGNPRAAQAVNGMTNPDAVDSWLIRKARVIKNFMARMFTSQNPAFIISNLSRDVIFAGTAVYAKEDAKYAARYAKNITVALAKGQLIGLIHRFETDRLDNSKDLDRYFGEFIRNGGETGFTQLNTVDDFKRDIDRFAREMKQGQVMKVSTKVWNGIWDGIEYMNRCAEDATRFSVYMTSRQMGRSVERSISDAKEITVNFNRKGSGGFGARLMNFAYIFFNAAVQSLANAGKIMYEHPMKALAALGAFSAAGFMAPLLAQAIISAFGGDDDAYWDLPEWVRRNNFVFYIPWSDNKFLIIPISQELRPFYAMGEIAMSVLMGKEEVLDGLKSAAGSFMDLLPIDFMGNGGNLAISLTPTVAQPFAQLVANTDYFGSPIYRRNDYNKLDPAWTKAYKGTSPMLVNASKWLNEVTGGDDVKRGWIDPINNPAVIEHLFESYLGGTGKTINRAAKTFSMIWNPDMRDIRNVPIASTFIQESDDERVAGNQLNREYFKLMDEFKETSHTVSGYKKKARMGSMEYADKLNEFMETADFERYSKARGYANTISKLRQALKRAQESGEDVMVEENLQQILHDLKRQMVEELKEQ